MILPNKISNVVIEIRNGTTVVSTNTLSVTNLRHPRSILFWEGRKGLSIGGVKRSKNIIRGFDSKLEFEWNDVRNQEQAILDLIDDLKTATDNDYDIRFNVQGDTDYLFLVPDEAVYNENYINQIKRTPTRVSFELSQVQDSIEDA